MRLARLILLASVALAACGGGKSASDGAADASGAGGSGGGGATGGSGGAGGNPACASAVATQPCTAEGTFCGGESCTDICQFCNVVRCTNGVWQQMEVAPVPCFSCADLFCQTNAQYCEVTAGSGATASFRCGATPAACRTAATCACLVSQGITTSGNCGEEGMGQLLVVVDAP